MHLGGYGNRYIRLHSMASGAIQDILLNFSDFRCKRWYRPVRANNGDIGQCSLVAQRYLKYFDGSIVEDFSRKLDGDGDDDENQLLPISVPAKPKIYEFFLYHSQRFHEYRDASDHKYTSLPPHDILPRFA